MRIVLMGVAGTGKGTQADYLVKKYNLPHISTGDIFRKNLKEKTEIGLKAKSFLEKGYLVPDFITTEIVEKRLVEVDCENGFILDGFPRNLAQAIHLDGFLSERNKKIDAVINIELNEDVLIKRALGRLVCIDCTSTFNQFFYPPKDLSICPKCGGKLIRREDDNLDSILNRISVYKGETLPLIEYYTHHGTLLHIDGTPSPAAVFKSIDSELIRIEKSYHL